MTHVLVVRLDNEGDVLLTGPAIRAVAKRASRVTMLCGPRGRAGAELLPGIDEVVTYRAPWIDPNPDPVERAPIEALVEELSQRRIDQAVVFTSFHQSALPTALVLRMAGVGTIAAISEDYPGSLLTVRHRVEPDIHEVERNLSLAATLGYALGEEDDSLAVTPQPAPPFELPSSYVVVHPGASVPARAWSPHKHRALATELVSRGRSVVITGSRSERELTRAVSGASCALDLGGRTTLGQLASVIERADAIVVGNTGPAHLAAAVHTPVVSIYAPTVPAVRWHPWRVPHVLLGDQDIECSGCRARVCPFQDHPCVEELPVALVADSVDALTMPSRPLTAVMT